jgi:SAM-dependent methyltransferase
MDAVYYKEYYHLERKNWWFKVRSNILEERIATLLPTKTNKQILNVGVATGATSEMLANFGSVMSVEYDKECFEFTKSILKSPIINGSILELPFEAQKYDLVCAFDVIEHVEDDSLAVAEMKRVCKKGGLIAVTVPAFMSLWGQHDVVNCHYRRYRMHQLIKLFEQGEKGQIVYKTYFNSFLFVPLLVFRNLMNLLPKNLFRKEGAGSDHSVIAGKNSIHAVLETIFDAERKLLNKGWFFPAGVSAMLIWKKEN